MSLSTMGTALTFFWMRERGDEGGEGRGKGGVREDGGLWSEETEGEKGKRVVERKRRNRVEKGEEEDNYLSNSKDREIHIHHRAS